MTESGKSIPEEVKWAPALKSCSWRVETINAASRDSKAKNEANSVVCQLEMESGDKNDIARFEVNRQEMKSLLGTLQEIDGNLQKLSSA
jgi:hypothetical protein